MKKTGKNTGQAILKRVEGGLCLCAGGKRTILSTRDSLLNRIQEVFKIDLGYRPPPAGTEPHKKYSDGTQCPYCHTGSTVGHGTRETRSEIHLRRLCNNCKRTYISGKHYPITEQISVTGKISFLTLCGYNATDISEKLEIPISAVNTHLRKAIKEPIKIKKSVILLDAEEFDKTHAPKTSIGATTYWEHRGTLCIGRKGCTDEVYISEVESKRLRSFNKKELKSNISKLSKEQQQILLGYVEDIIDYELGYFPVLKIDTRVNRESGELNLEMFEAGQQNVMNDSGQ